MAKKLALCLLLAGAVSGGEAERFLSACCAFTPAELERLNKAEAIARLIKTPDREASILGAVKLRASKEEFLAWFRNLDNFKLSPMVAEVKTFHNPPRSEDLASLSLDTQELRDARNCVPGKCGLKLSSEEMARIRKNVDWAVSDANSKASDQARNLFLDYVKDYFLRGNAALGKLNDRNPGSSIAETFTALNANFPYLKEAFPEAFNELVNFNGMGRGNPDQFVYWSREKYGFGLKPLLNITHVSIFKPRPDVILIASKQIRTTHYFDGSFGVTMLVDAPGGAFLVYINRSRIDMLHDAGWFRRTLIERALPGATRREIVGIRDRVGKTYVAPRQPKN